MDLAEFDFGAELSEAIDHIKVWPKDGEMTALVDGDLLPYIIGYSIPELMLFQAEKRVREGECQKLSDTPEFEQVKQKLCMTMNRWITSAGCDSAYIYMTDSAKNFRINVAIQRQYKGNRKSEKPPFFYESREFMIEHLGAILSDGEEADDLITIHLWTEFNRLKAAGVELGSASHKQLASLVVCSKDKDLAISCGWHLDVTKYELTWVTYLGELYPRWNVSKKTGKSSIDQIKGDGIKFFYAQMLLGDGVDNYTGIPRMLKRDIYDLLNPCKTEEELYYAVLSAYNKKYSEQGCLIENYRGGSRHMKPYEIMVEQGRLAHMQRHKGEVWRAKVSIPLGSDASSWN
ncbi:5'-3'exonuclease [Erwinia phage VL73]